MVQVAAPSGFLSNTRIAAHIKRARHAQTFTLERNGSIYIGMSGCILRTSFSKDFTSLLLEDARGVCISGNDIHATETLSTVLQWQRYMPQFEDDRTETLVPTRKLGQTGVHEMYRLFFSEKRGDIWVSTTFTDLFTLHPDELHHFRWELSPTNVIRVEQGNGHCAVVHPSAPAIY